MKTLLLCLLLFGCSDANSRHHVKTYDEYKYEIIDVGHRYYYTDEIYAGSPAMRDSSSCITFVDSDGEESSVCGSFTIRQRL